MCIRNLIATWKKTARQTVLAGFSGNHERQEASRETEVKELRAKIGELVIAGVLCLLMGGWLWRRGLNLSPAERLIAASLPALTVLAATLSLDPILTAPAENWNDMRLAPAASLARGRARTRTPASSWSGILAKKNGMTRPTISADRDLDSCLPVNSVSHSGCAC